MQKTGKALGAKTAEVLCRNLHTHTHRVYEQLFSSRACKNVRKCYLKTWQQTGGNRRRVGEARERISVSMIAYLKLGEKV